MPPAPAPAPAPAALLHTEALVIGAGPVGLFQVFQLGLQDIPALVLDVLPHAGGQCTELYADKPIYDIPALPHCTGQELVQRLLQQAAPFRPRYQFGQQVSELQVLAATEGQVDAAGGPRFVVRTRQGLHIGCRAIFIAAGVGAFLPRPLKLAGIEVFEGGQLLYGLDAASEATALAGQHVVVSGQDEAALSTVLRLADVPCPASLSLLHRRDEFSASPATVARLRAAVASGAVQLVIGHPTGFEQHQGRLQALQLATPSGDTRRLPLDTLLVLHGLSPKLGPVAQWGLALERKQLRVDTEAFQTSVPGIFAVGDVNTYPGKRKLIVCGFHEATLAAYAAAAQLYPQRPVLQQYTTSSPHLQQLLGVLPPAGPTAA